MEIHEIRLAGLRALLAEEGGRKSRLAARIKKSPSQLSQWLSTYRTISEQSARDIERNAKKPVGWLDQPWHSAAASGGLASAGPPPDYRPIAPDIIAGLAELLDALPEHARDLAAQRLAQLAHAPDSAKARESAIAALAEPPPGKQLAAA